MKTALLALPLFAASTAFAAEATIGAANCLVITSQPIPKESVKWNGACKDGFADGEGDLEWFVNGAFHSYYKGPLVRGRKHGVGYRKSSDGREYEGVYVDGLREGRGIMLYGGGDRYEGQWKADVPHGAGTMVYALGGRYEGKWDNGDHHGQGKATYAGGQVVEGTFVDGVAPGANGREKPQKVGRYALKSDHYYKYDAANGSKVPYEKSYNEMTRDEQLAIKENYRLLFEGDEPPYPLNGTSQIYTWFHKAAEKVLSSGLLRMDVMVDSKGDAETVTIYSAPHPDMKTLAAQIVMAEKYKPALCSGKPCAMAFPYAIEFTIH